MLNNAVDKKSIKIAFCVWSLAVMGGSEHVVYDIVRTIDRRFFDVLVVGFEDGPLRSLYEKIGVKAVAVKKAKSRLGFVSALRKLFKNEKVKIINAHHLGPILYCYLSTRLLHIKIVHTEHSVWQHRDLNTPLRAVANGLLLGADAIVAISKQLQAYYLNNPFAFNRKLHLIMNGIDIKRYRAMDCSSLKAAMGFSKEDLLVGMVANLRPEKNHKLLIRAFSLVAATHPNANLLIAGLDCMDAEIQRFAAKCDCSDKIHFLGPRDDVEEILNILDVFCLTSIHEGMPLTVLEAMACGAPVVGADVLGINELVHDNQNGLLFNSGDEIMLAEKISILLDNHHLRQKIRKNAQKYVLESYALDDSVKQYERLFRALIT